MKIAISDATRRDKMRHGALTQSTDTCGTGADRGCSRGRETGIGATSTDRLPQDK